MNDYFFVLLSVKFLFFVHVFKTADCNLFIFNMLWGFFQKRTFGLLFFAVVRFSPPSQETEAAKRKAKAKNNSPDPQEPIYNLLVAAKGEARCRAKIFVNSVDYSENRLIKKERQRKFELKMQKKPNFMRLLTISWCKFVGNLKKQSQFATSQNERKCLS